MDISCAFATSAETPSYVGYAEELGYRRAWLYDSPALYSDVWMTLARCAERTSTIGLGPGVLVPGIRHPMVNAAAISDLANMAPGRVTVAIGSGFTGSLALGQRPTAWRTVADYVRCVRSLLAGQEAHWNGAVVSMLHLPGFGAPRPVDVPILIAAEGPKGFAVAEELGDGVLCASVPRPGAVDISAWRALLAFGTILDAGEDLTTARVLDAVAPSTALLLHAAYEHQGAEAVDRLPGGRQWRSAIENVPESRRHLAIHEGHLVAPNSRDLPHIAELAPTATPLSLTGSAEAVKAKIHDLDAQGVTEVVYQPAGGDIEGELRRFAAATIG